MTAARSRIYHARDAAAYGYGGPSYWAYLDATATEQHAARVIFDDDEEES